MTTIAFAPLVDSPETLGDGAGYLPKLRVVGSDQTNFGVAVLPALTNFTVSTQTGSLTGIGVAYLPKLRGFGTNVTSPIYVTSDGVGIAYLPMLTTIGDDAGTLIAPATGTGIGYLPALFANNANNAGTDGRWGTSITYLPRVIAFGTDTAGGYGINILPKLTTVAQQAASAPTNYFTLYQSPGVLEAFVSNTKYNNVADAMLFNTVSGSALIKTLLDNLQLTGTPFPTTNRLGKLSDNAAFAEAIAIVWKILLADNTLFNSVVSGTPTRLAAVMDILLASGVVTTTMQAKEALAASLALKELIAGGWKLTAIDSMAFAEALKLSLTGIGKLLDNTGFGEVLSPQMRVTLLMSDKLAFLDVQSTSLQAFEKLLDSAVFFTSIRLGAGDYSGWVLNEGAASEYRNYPFNGFCEFPPGSKNYYGTSDNGLFILTGSTDNGVPISSYITTALMDFGTGKRKRIPDAYIAFSGGNTMLLKVITTDHTGLQQETWYTATLQAGNTQHAGRIKIGRGLDSRYWQFTLQNVNGADYALDQLQFRPLVLDRRI